MKNNAIKEKSFAFALRIVKLYQFLVEQKKEYVFDKYHASIATDTKAILKLLTSIINTSKRH